MSSASPSGWSRSDAWTRSAHSAAERQVRHGDRMAEELHRLGDHFRDATRVGRQDRVLDIGCGTGESTRDAGRAAPAGSVLGIDNSASMIHRAQHLTEDAGLRNVSYLHADAQTHRFPPEQFDVGISRFGTMFFTDPVAALTNIAHALRPRGRLVLMVWQSPDSNEWYTMVREAFGATGSRSITEAVTDDPFSLADPATTTNALTSAGFTEVEYTDVREVVYYGPDVEAAYAFVAGMRHTQDLAATMDKLTAEQAHHRLRDALAQHDTGTGVDVDSAAWIVTALRLG